MKQELKSSAIITLNLIGNKWNIFIIQELLTGAKRFGELKKSLNCITQKVLTDNLRLMEESGLLTRTVFAEVPPKVEYELTELGYSLIHVIDVLTKWGEEYNNNFNKYDE